MSGKFHGRQFCMPILSTVNKDFPCCCFPVIPLVINAWRAKLLLPSGPTTQLHTRIAACVLNRFDMMRKKPWIWKFLHTSIRLRAGLRTSEALRYINISGPKNWKVEIWTKTFIATNERNIKYKHETGVNKNIILASVCKDECVKLHIKMYNVFLAALTSWGPTQ
jgi:hypothetical protein